MEVWSDDQLQRLKQRTPPLVEPVVGAIRRIGPFQRLTQQPLQTPSFVDTQLDLNQPQSVAGDPIFDRPLHADHLDESGREYRRAVFAYRVRAVDESGKEGGPSPAWFTIPSSPQQVFSHEDGTTCQLKWMPNPEQGLAGYRVYRMDGRYDKEPVTRLTAKPLPQITFQDETAGKQPVDTTSLPLMHSVRRGFPRPPCGTNGNGATIICRSLATGISNG